MCQHDDLDDSPIRLGWICARCDSAWSPDIYLCEVCNDLEENHKCLHNMEEEQDAILNNERLFATLKGN